MNNKIKYYLHYQIQINKLCNVVLKDITTVSITRYNLIINQ